MTLPQLLRDWADKQPNATALQIDDTQVTYQGLDRMSNRVANGLKSLNVKRDSRVAILDHNSLHYFETLLGASKLGAVLVGINARLAGPEVAYILNDSGAEVLFVGEDHFEMVNEILDDLESVQAVIAFSTEPPFAAPVFDGWRDSFSHDYAEFDLDDDGDFVQLYTSGTTGNPKGACHTHRNWVLATAACHTSGWGDMQPDSVAMVNIPLYHVAGLMLSTLALRGGGCVVITRNFDPEEILEIVPALNVTDTLWVPSVIQAILAHPNAANTDFSSLRTISYGAAPMPEDLLLQASETFGCGFMHLYGMTEVLGAVTYLPDDMHRKELGKLRSCGRAYDGVGLRVVAESGDELGPGEVGEVIVRCPWLMRCYWRKDDSTIEAVRDGWLYTGDAGKLDEDGYLYLVDRIKDMIISGGENVYPAEVENALFGHSAIADVAVIGVPDEKWGEVPKALVVLKPGATLDVDDLLDFARERIGGFKVPKIVETIDELPRNASGKVLRRVLRTQAGAS